MPRPCTCERVTAPAWSADQCRLCWLYRHRDDYRRLWDGGSPAAVLAPSRMVRKPAARPASPAVAASPRAPCAHLGDPTGTREPCPSCRGHVEVKLRACALHGSCTTHKSLDGLACCQTCPDHTAP